ncbi:hypothetical protein EDB19DRAFT_1918812 [Suillus lakei]|nr:hypothetical protein EDB19DRAFT_1918812 [Suillus lakei]
MSIILTGSFRLACCKYLSLFELILMLTPVARFEAEKGVIIRILQPLVGCEEIISPLLRTESFKLVLEAATIIVLEYSAFLLNDDPDELEHVRSAVDYYLKSPKAVAVEKVAQEISRQGYKKEELRKKIFEFILENRMCTSFASFGTQNSKFTQPAAKDLTEQK